MKELMDCKAFKQYLRFLKDNKIYSHTITINGTETKKYLSEIRYKDYKEKGYESRYTKNSIAYIQQLTNMLIPLSVSTIEYKSISNKFFKRMQRGVASFNFAIFYPIVMKLILLI